MNAKIIIISSIVFGAFFSVLYFQYSNTPVPEPHVEEAVKRKPELVAEIAILREKVTQQKAKLAVIIESLESADETKPVPEALIQELKTIVDLTPKEETQIRKVVGQKGAIAKILKSKKVKEYKELKEALPTYVIGGSGGGQSVVSGDDSDDPNSPDETSPDASSPDVTADSEESVVPFYTHINIDNPKVLAAIKEALSEEQFAEFMENYNAEKGE